MQNADIVTSVTMIIENPKMNPTLKVSIFLTQARGENKAKTIRAKYSYFKSFTPVIASVLDFKL